MRQDWVEFEGKEGRKMLTRADHIVNIREVLDVTNEKAVVVGSSDAGTFFDIYTYEPYEQVKRKIMDATKVDYSDVAADHFTIAEYECLLNGVTVLMGHYLAGNMDKEEKACNDLIGKLNKKIKEKILEEDK